MTGSHHVPDSWCRSRPYLLEAASVAFLCPTQSPVATLLFLAVHGWIDCGPIVLLSGPYIVDVMVVANVLGGKLSPIQLPNIAPRKNSITPCTCTSAFSCMWRAPFHLLWVKDVT